MITQTNHGLGLALEGRPIQISRCVIDGIAAEHHQRLHLTGLERLRQLDNRAFFGLGRFVENDRLAQVPQRIIDGQRQQMHRQRLTITRNDQRVATMGHQILRAFADPLRIDSWRFPEMLEAS